MAIEVRVPDLGESVVEATVARWLKQPGESVAAGEALVVLETDKINLEVPSPAAGTLGPLLQAEGADVKVGDVLATVEAGAAAASPPASTTPAETPPEPEAAQAPPPEPPAADKAADKATPVARRVADEMHVDIAQVQPQSGARVTKDDVLRHAAPQPPHAPTHPSSPPRGEDRPERPAVTAFGAGGGPSAPDRAEERVRMSRRRRTIAARLVEAQRTAAMLTTFNEADMSAVMDLRARRKEAFQAEHGVGLGFSAFFVKASIAALRAFPMLNAEIDGEEIVLKRYYDIGIAIGAAEGLVVPVLRDADRMSFAQIEQAIKGFAQRSEAGTLTLEDLRGGSFTITNGGVFGSLMSTPILNAPQVAILGLHKIGPRPVAAGDQVVIRPMMYLALSYDHRIVDGREAVQFLVRVKELIEDPGSLLIQG